MATQPTSTIRFVCSCRVSYDLGFANDHVDGTIEGYCDNLVIEGKSMKDDPTLREAIETAVGKKLEEFATRVSISITNTPMSADPVAE